MEFAVNRFRRWRLMTPTRHPWGRSFFCPGCLARHFLSGWVYDLIGRTLPYGTLAVN